MGLFNWDSPAHRLQNSQLSKTLVLQLCSRDVSQWSGARRERSLWSLEAQVCRCQLKKEEFISVLIIHTYFSFLVAVSSWFLSV